MPVFKVTSPDGRTFRVTAPEGATQADAIAYVQKNMADKPAGLRTEGNIDLHSRPVAKNGDGFSTVRSISIGTDDGEVLIPTVSDDGKLLTNKQAEDLYFKSGRHLGIFDTPENATAYAQKLHRAQAREYAQPEKPYNPTDDMSTMDRLLAGTGRGMVNVYN